MPTSWKAFPSVAGHEVGHRDSVRVVLGEGGNHGLHQHPINPVSRPMSRFTNSKLGLTGR